MLKSGPALAVRPETNLHQLLAAVWEFVWPRRVGEAYTTGPMGGYLRRHCCWVGHVRAALATLGWCGIKTTKCADDDVGICLPAPEKPMLALLCALRLRLCNEAGSSSPQLGEEELMRQAWQLAETAAAGMQYGEPPPPWDPCVLWALGADAKFSSSRQPHVQWPVGDPRSGSLSTITVFALTSAGAAAEAGSRDGAGQLAQYR